VLAAISAGSRGVEVRGDALRVTAAEGVIGTIGAPRGFSGVRLTSVNVLFLVVPGGVVSRGGGSIVPVAVARGGEIGVEKTVSRISL
jgi:hypothetical protein